MRVGVWVQVLHRFLRYNKRPPPGGRKLQLQLPETSTPGLGILINHLIKRLKFQTTFGGPMTADTRNTVTDQPQRNIVARTIGEQAVLAVIGGGPGQRGPWPYVTGIPNLDFDMVAPLPNICQ